jgi:hypothetical protein
LAYQIRLPRMHQAAALVVINEEVTVDAKTQLSQFFEHLLLGMRVPWPSSYSGAIRLCAIST